MFYLRFYNLGFQSLITCVSSLDWSVKDLLTSLTNQRRHKSQHVVTCVYITTIHQSQGMSCAGGRLSTTEATSALSLLQQQLDIPEQCLTYTSRLQTIAFII